MPKDEQARCPYEDTCPFAMAMNARAALAKGVKGLKGLLPEEFWGHLVEAERETLLAIRGLIDGLLEAMPKGKGGRRTAQRIKVE
ncbi:MAG: hypothetical protein HY347_10060 [candidate division NC10 bacterium]|nr:hypothetical protein [candidate division NC10 bacterium]